MSDLSDVVADLQARLANMIKRGTVHSVSFEQTPPRVKVEYEKGVTTAWLPFISGRASTKSRIDWEPIAIGEQVIIFSESGNLGSGIVLPALLNEDNSSPSISPDEHVSLFSDGTKLLYNRKTHILKIKVKGALELSCDQNITINSKADINFKAGGNIKLEANKIDLN